MRGCKGNSSSFFYCQRHPHHHPPAPFQGGETGPQRQGVCPEVTRGTQHRTQARACPPGPVLPTLQGQLGRAGNGEQDNSLNHTVKFRRRRKKNTKNPAAAGGVPRAGALPSRSQGSGRVGMMQPGPTAVSGATFAGNLPADAARTAEAPGRRAEPAAQADSTGPPRVGRSVRSGSAPSPHPREPPPTSPHPETPRPDQQENLGGQQEPPLQGRGQAGAGKSPKAHERGRPGSGPGPAVGRGHCRRSLRRP